MSERTTGSATPYQTGQSASRSSDDSSIGELFSELARDTQSLLRQEMELARTEMTRSAREAGMAVAKIAASALVLYAGFLMLLWAAVFGLREADLSWWASALIVGAAALIVGLILLMWARAQMRNVSIAPRETIETLKEDRAWAKGQMP
jgi:hypothetical protein